LVSVSVALLLLASVASLLPVSVASLPPVSVASLLPWSVASLLAFAAGALGAVGAAMLLAPLRRRSSSSRGAGVLRALAAAGARLAPGARPGPGAATAPGDLAGRIAAAGYPAGLGAREVMAAKLAAAVLGGLVGVLLAGGAPGRLGPLVVLAAPCTGFLAPNMLLGRIAAERARRVRRELPALLDLLRVTVEAGCSLPEALRLVGERAAGPLAGEWRAVGRQVALGVPLQAALAGMAERVPLPEVRALAAALDRARRHGAPLADTLAAQARDARFALARRIREDAARAGPKMQLVVALLLVPSVLLLVAAALAAALLGPGGHEVVPV
jgi:tight adherence protein C